MLERKTCSQKNVSRNTNANATKSKVFIGFEET